MFIGCRGFNMKKFRVVNNIANICMLIAVIVSVSACNKDMSVAERIEKANLYIAANDYRNAIIELKNGIQSNEKNKDLRLLLGKVYLELGEGINAEKELHLSELLGEKRENIDILLGNSYLLQNKYEKILADIKYDENADNVRKSEIYFLHGEAYRHLVQLEKAEENYREAQKYEDKIPKSLIGLARVAKKRGKFNEAESYLIKAVKLYPDYIDAIVFSGELYTDMGQHDKAENNYKRVLLLEKQKDYTGLKYIAAIGLVTLQIMQGRLDDAEIELNSMANALPDHPQVKYLQAWHVFHKNNYETANMLLLEVQKSAPDYMPGLLLLGASNYALKNYEQANIYLTRFVHNVPGHIQGVKLLGATRLKLGQPEKAMEILQSDISINDKEIVRMAGEAAALIGKSDVHLEFLKKVVKAEPDNQSMKTELAKSYLQQGLISEAISELESLQVNEDNKNPKLLLIYAHLRAGNYDKARKTAKEMLANNNSDPNAHAIMGEVEFKSGQIVLARKYFNDALKLDKTHALSIASLARIDMSDGKLDEASRRFDQILMADKKSIMAMLGQAQIAEKRGDDNKMLSWLEKARSTDDRAILPRYILARHYLSNNKPDLALTLAEEINALQPDSGMSILLLGRTQLMSGKIQHAVSTFQELTKRLPSNPESYIELATAQFAEGNVKLAQESLLKALTLDGRNLKAKIMLANFQLKNKNYDKALVLVDEIKNEHSDKSAGFHIEGDIRMQQGKLQLAQKAYQSAIGKEPSALVITKLSYAFSSNGEIDKSITALKKGIATYPDNHALRISLATLYQQQGNLKEAEKLYIKILEQQPLNVVALNNMASILTNRDLNKALSYAKQGYKLAPKSMAVLDTYGWLLVLHGQLSEGLDVLTQAVSLGDNPTVKYHYAVALGKNSNSDKARDVLNILLNSGINFPEQNEARKFLAELK